MSEPATILIVDDEPNVRLVFRVALESAGHRCREAVDGASARELLAGVEVDLVLLDLRMPGDDGIATLRRLRDAGVDVPVVILTAHGSVPDAVAAMKLGAVDFLAKPITPDALRRAVDEVLRRSLLRAAPGSPTLPPPVAVTADSQRTAHLAQARRALNHRWFDEAEVFLKQAVGLDPASAEAHNLLGVLHELRGQHDACYREYKSALKAQGDYPPAQRNMTRYYERITFGSSAIPVDLGEA